MDTENFCFLNLLLSQATDLPDYSLEETKEGVILHTHICDKITFFPQCIQFSVHGEDFEIGEMLTEHLYWLMVCVEPIPPWVYPIMKHLKTIPCEVKKLVDIARLNIYTHRARKFPTLAEGESVLRRRMMDIHELMFADQMHKGVDTFKYTNDAVTSGRSIFHYPLNVRTRAQAGTKLDFVHLMLLEAAFTDVHDWIQVGKDDFICRIEGLTFLLIGASNVTYQSIVVFIPRNMCVLMGVKLPTCDCSHTVLLKNDYMSLKFLCRNYKNVAAGRNGLQSLSSMSATQMCTNMTMDRVKLLNKLQSKVITRAQFDQLGANLWRINLNQLRGKCPNKQLMQMKLNGIQTPLIYEITRHILSVDLYLDLPKDLIVMMQSVCPCPMVEGGWAHV